MMPRFIKVIKDNKTKDRGFIAVDAICSVFEDKESHNVSIMTMDGFWYEVIDTVEELYAAVNGFTCDRSKQQDDGNPKKDYIRRKRMMPSQIENDHPKQNHEDLRRERKVYESDAEVVDVFQPGVKESRRNGTPRKNRFSSDLPTGVGEGQVGGGSMSVTPTEES